MLGLGLGLNRTTNNIISSGGGSGFILDTYEADSAYSFRQLRTGVTSVCRVRRSSDNTEADFTATEVSDGTLTTWVGAGNDGFVVKRYQQAAGGPDQIQPTASYQPYIVEAGVLVTVNGKPAMRNPSGDTRWLYGADTFSGGDMNFTSFIVYKAESHANGNANCFGSIYPSTSGFDRRYLQIVSDGLTSSSVRYQGGNTVYSGGDGLNQSLRTDVKTPTNPSSGRINGSAVSVSSSSSNTLSIITDSAYVTFLGGATGYTNALTSTSYGRGYEQEAIWFISDESANISAIETDINNHFSIW